MAAAPVNHDQLLGRLAGMLLDFPTLVMSGTRLAKELGVSRSAVWQAAEQLRQYGVELDGHRGTGYQLRAIPDLLLPRLLLPALETRSFGRKCHHRFQSESTQQSAWEAAMRRAQPAAEGELWVAETQSAGRGRLGRSWSSPPATGIYASVVLRPAGPPAAILPLTLLAALAVREAVAATTGLEADIRWPNDLLLGEKKFCGLLLDMSAEATRVHAMVLGVGINVHAREFPPELSGIATALGDQTRRRLSRVQLLAAVLRRLEERYLAFQPGETAAVLAEFERRSSYARGRQVRVGELRGVTEGLDESGFLRLRLEGGGVQTIFSGEVRPAND